MNDLTLEAKETYKHIDSRVLVDSLFGISDLDFDNMKYTNLYGSKHSISIPLSKLVSINNDVCSPELLIINSYNKESSLFIGIGLYRFVCTNGIVVGTDFYSQRVRHVPGQKVDMFLVDYLTNIKRCIEYINTDFAYDLSHLTGSNLNKSGQAIAEELYSNKLITKPTLKLVTSIYDTGDFNRDEDAANFDNVWGLMNIINESMRLSRTERTSDGSLFVRNNNLLSNILLSNDNLLKVKKVA